MIHVWIKSLKEVFLRYSSAKKQTVRIEDIYPEPIFDESDESSDSDNNDNNMDIDNNDSDTEIDQGWADTDDFVYLGNDPAEHMTVSPDVSTIASTWE